MKVILRTLIPLIILLLAYGVAKRMIAGKPELQSKQPVVVIPSVDAITRSIGTHSPEVTTFGTVESYFETNLTPQVSGSITFVSDQFRVGRVISKGSVLARMDTTNYQATLAQEIALLATNQRSLEEEIIQAKQAEDDWIASGRKITAASPFVLRKPQLAAANASIDSVQAAIKQAQADIDRCTIIAPFDAVVSNRNASVGNFATTQNSLGTIISTEKAEIRLPLTPSQAARIKLPTESSAPQQISITSPTRSKINRKAMLVRTEPVIDPTNQVIFVIAELEHPYAEENSLPIGSFVNAAIPSKEMPNTLEVPEACLVNDSYIWAIDQEQKLVKLPASRLYSHLGNTYIQLNKPTLESPFLIVSRPLTNFRTGMKVNPIE